MKYYLDTNIIIYLVKGKHPAIQEHLRHIPLHSIGVPSMVLAEIEYGVQKSNNYIKTKTKYSAYTNLFSSASFSKKAAMYYGQIRGYLEKKGTPIGHNDMIIAATVLAEDGVLVTHNVKEFSRIPILRVVDWTEGNTIN
ncbi:MAG: type II toxin-antitoxin system VapC family toxin [Eubacterium sp.]|nr:type II toxin-antitoxin system VapC family toxin [Candidatus Colimonas fimequi]